MMDVLGRSDVVIGLVAAIIGAIIAPFVWKLLKGLLLFIPTRLGRGFSDMWGHLGKLNRAKSDPIAAAAYVGFQLSQLCVYILLTAVAYVAVEVLGRGDASWTWKPHGWILGVLIAVLALFMFRVAKRAFQLFLFYGLVMNPADLSKPTKIGNVEIGAFTPPETQPPSPEKPGEGTPDGS